MTGSDSRTLGASLRIFVVECSTPVDGMLGCCQRFRHFGKAANRFDAVHDSCPSDRDRRKTGARRAKSSPGARFSRFSGLVVIVGLVGAEELRYQRLHAFLAGTSEQMERIQP